MSGLLHLLETRVLVDSHGWQAHEVIVFVLFHQFRRDRAGQLAGVRRPVAGSDHDLETVFGYCLDLLDTL